MQGMFTYAGKDIAWQQQGKRVISQAVTHPSGKVIRFRSAAHLERHVVNMRGKALTVPPRPNKNRRRAGS